MKKDRGDDGEVRFEGSKEGICWYFLLNNQNTVKIQGRFTQRCHVNFIRFFIYIGTLRSGGWVKDEC